MTFIFDPASKLIYDLDALPFVRCGAITVFLIPDATLEDPWKGFFEAWQKHISKDLNGRLAAILRPPSKGSAK
jgi:hypothetical protein